MRPCKRTRTKLCEHCKTPFERTYIDSRWAKLRFCSTACRGFASRQDITTKFWNKVIKNKTGCWGWKGAKTFGYGILGDKPNKTTIRASRLSWELHNGAIPAGLFVCHKCDNPECVNPEHLFLGTQKDNIRDMHAKGRDFNGVPKMSEHTRAEIRSAYEKDFSYGCFSRIARQFNTNDVAIRRVILGHA